MLYAGVDIAKRFHVMCVKDPDGSVVLGPSEYANDAPGLRAMLADLASLSGPDGLSVGMEATGHYWRSCHAALSEGGYSVCVMNPLRTRALRDATNLGRAKTDRVDCGVIADALRMLSPRATAVAPERLSRLRDLSRFQQSLASQVSEVKQRLTIVLDQVWPEFSRCFSSPFTGSALAVLRGWGTPDRVREAPVADIAAAIASASRNRFREAKAAEVSASAFGTCGIPATCAHRLMLSQLLAQYDLLAAQAAEVDEALLTLLHEVAPQVLTVPGVSARLGAQIVAEVGDVSRFPSASHLVSFAGLDPVRCQSGDFEAPRSRISKKGSPHLRRALYLASMANLGTDSVFRVYYDRHRGRGAPHRYALCATARKMACVVYAILRTGEDFDPTR